MLRDRQIGLALWVAFILGCILRFLPGALTGFPVNDGGMLLAMARDLHANGYLFPATTSYNHLDIPFAYPPLGIYVAAFLTGQLSISEFELFRWLPPIVSIAIIPAFYWLVRQILDSKSKAAIATLLYTLMPGSSDWLVMGGGLSRGLGILFSLLAIGHTYRLVRGDERRSIIAFTVLFSALTVLSHPEAGLQTAAVCFVMWIYYGRSISGVKNAGLVALGTALLTAPWWLTVLYHHGFSPFWSAMQTGIHETMLPSLFYTLFSTQGSLPILAVLSLLGIILVLRRRELLLLLWFIFPFVVDPRNASAIAMFPLLMLAAEGLYYLYTQFLHAYSETFPNSKNASRYLPFLIYGSFGLMLLYLFWTAFTATSRLPQISLSLSDRETMEWVRENTPAKGRFLLLTNTGTISPMTDAYQEWFPVLAERQSRNTLQGLEWLIGPEFYEHSRELVALQRCRNVDCLNEWLEQNNLEVEFILVQKQRTAPALIDSLRVDERYERIYESPSAEVFALRP